MQEKTLKKEWLSGPFFATITVMGLAVLVLCLYHSALHGWWRWDDTYILKLAASQTPFDYFFSPDDYQLLSPQNFTPWLIFSFDLDFYCFGFEPARFYARQLMDLWLAGVVSYFLLRLWVPNGWAALGGALCIVGAPVATTVQQLMTRHYMEGLIFALLALYLFLISIKGARRFSLILGAIFYLLAMGSKEVFVPLVAICIFWPEGPLRKRLLALIPYFSALILYVFWREFMIDMVSGGYHINWNTLLSFPLRACHSFFGSTHFSVIIGILVVLVLFSSLVKKVPRRIVFAAIVIIAAVGPLMPLKSTAMAGRYFLLPWWVFSMILVVVLGSRQIPKKVPFVFNLLVFCIVGLAALLHSHSGLGVMESVMKRFDTQGRFLWESEKSRAVLYAPATSHFAHYFSSLQWLKHQIKGVSQPFRIMGDEIELKALGDHLPDVFAYEPESRSIQDVSNRIPLILESWQEKQRVMPLSFRFDYGEDKTAVWQCGPYSSGVYTLLSRYDKPQDDPLKSLGMNKFPIPQSGQYRVTLEYPLFYYLRYDSPQGWTTYSPLLHFNPGGKPIHWSRKSDSNISDTTVK